MSASVPEVAGAPEEREIPGPAAEAGAAAPDSPEQRLAEARVVLLLADEANLEVVGAFLTEAGYRNHFGATDRGESFDLLFNERPDVVLLDLGLGQGAGLDILSWMQSDRILRHVPVIALAESDDRATRLRALELGAAVFLRKPVDGAELTLRLRNTLTAKIYQDGLAWCDPLTGLANRERFLDRLEWALRHARRYGTAGAVLQIGIDRFKQINEALGPGVGDRVLRTVAQRLEECVRESDLVARDTDAEPGASLSRLGGDEFTVLLPVVAQTDAAAHVARRILEQVAAPLTVDDRELFLTCCVGISVFPNDGTVKDAVLRDAGIAMRHAKQQGRDTFHYYSEELNARSLQRLSLESDLRRALQRDELVLHYQPKFDVATGRLTGAEALLRWQHPERGMVSPGEFIPVAEETGLIMQLGDRVMQIACAQIATWRDAGLEPPRIAVNVSSHQFRRRTFGQEVIRLLGDTDVGGGALTVEMTESAVMENAAESVRVLGRLKEAGIRLSIDDFGTGYSSLSYLKRFPLDEIKIDRSFLAEIDRDKDSIAIATAIIAMSHGLGFRVVAEGVETEHQLAFLREQRCDECQGFLTGRPMPPEAFAALLASGGRPAGGFPAEGSPAEERERAALRLVQAGEAAR